MYVSLVTIKVYLYQSYRGVLIIQSSTIVGRVIAKVDLVEGGNTISRTRTVQSSTIATGRVIAEVDLVEGGNTITSIAHPSSIMISTVVLEIDLD